MDSSSKHNPMVNYGNNLHPYVAPVNHNFLNEAKALNIAHTMGIAHGKKGTNACVVVGFNNMVRIHQHLFLFHDPTIPLTNHKPT
jgi:hypothetical protein